MNIKKISAEVWSQIYPERKPWEQLAVDTQNEWIRFTTIAIEVFSKEINLDQQLQWLNALEAAGVDNWEGYDFARELLNQ